MGISQDLAFAMLIKNGWNLEQTKEAFGSDFDYIKKTFKFELGGHDEKADSQPFLCPVCYDEYAPHEVTRLADCGHALCNECYRYTLEAKLSMGPECVHAICPDPKCNMIIPARIFKQLLPNSQY